jgi:catechol 2,3-dioxygenase-like lactoylglutathione lyase family enzyme
MEPRLTLITLAVADVEASRRFYERLGFRASRAGVAGEVAFFDAGGAVLALWRREALAADSRVAIDRPGSAGVALAHNARDRDAVDRALAEAAAAGGRIVKPAIATDWGGYAGYFADPDGHLWEVAWNPHWPLDDRGLVRLPDPAPESTR